MPPDLALLLTLTGSNYPCLELISMVPKVFEPLKFDCIQFILISPYQQDSLAPYQETDSVDYSKGISIIVSSPYLKHKYPEVPFYIIEYN